MHVSDSSCIDFYEAVHIIVVPVHNVKAYWGIGGIAPLIPFVGTRRIDWSMSLHGCFTRRVKAFRYALNKQQGGRQTPLEDFSIIILIN
jgi:hypothetical protein